MGRRWRWPAVVLGATLLVACSTTPQDTTAVPGGGPGVVQATDPAAGGGIDGPADAAAPPEGTAGAGADGAAAQVPGAQAPDPEAAGSVGGEAPAALPGAAPPPAEGGAVGAPAGAPGGPGHAGGEHGRTAGAAGGGPQVPVDGAGPLGSACRPMLQPHIPRVVVEVDAQDGAALPPGVIDHLVGTLAAVADKPAGVEVVAGTVEGGPREWGLEDVRAVAAATRDVSQSAEVVALHVLSLSGRPDPADERIATSIGIAFDATSFVVFPHRVDALTTLVGGEAILRAVVVHELGHLLCLVNIGMTSPIAHEDPASPGHSASRESVMYHAIETTAVSQIFAGPPPDTFDADDLADLEGLRTGRY